MSRSGGERGTCAGAPRSALVANSVGVGVGRRRGAGVQAAGRDQFISQHRDVPRGSARSVVLAAVLPVLGCAVQVSFSFARLDGYCVPTTVMAQPTCDQCVFL